MKPDYQEVVDVLDIAVQLAPFSPLVIGTPPLGIATQDSDIDIACSSEDFDLFLEIATKAYGHFHAFQNRLVTHLDAPACIVSFEIMGWDIELFCQKKILSEQLGVRHFLIEKRVLDLMPDLRPKLLRLKRNGMHTEAAFAKCLGLSGDPFQSILSIEGLSDEEIVALATHLRSH